MGVDAATDCPAGPVAAARDSARHFLEGLVPALASEAADTVVLVVSELVTNALRHGGGTCPLDLTAHRTASRWPCTTTVPVPRACAPPPRPRRRRRRLRPAPGQPTRHVDRGHPASLRWEDGVRPSLAVAGPVEGRGDPVGRRPRRCGGSGCQRSWRTRPAWEGSPPSSPPRRGGTGRPPVCTSPWRGSFRARWGSRRQAGCTASRSWTSALGPWATSATPIIGFAPVGETAHRYARGPDRRVPGGPSRLFGCRLTFARGWRSSRRGGAEQRGGVPDRVEPADGTVARGRVRQKGVVPPW